jgi:formylglycine-generating enzyme required for sulfatase activity
MQIRIKQILSGLLLAGLAMSAGGQVMDESTNADMVLVPAGEFTMGSNKQEDATKEREANALNPFGFIGKLYVDEHPAHRVMVPAFLMDKYEVTNAQYLAFLKGTKREIPPAWQQNGYNLTDPFLASLPVSFLREVASLKFNLDMDVPNASREELLAELQKVQRARDRLPVTNVSWFDARDYCAWADKRLPTEAEWEKAARGPEGFEFPWGNNWDPSKINTMSEDPDQPYSAVGSYPGDKSGYGVYDMASNVAEWVADWYDAYPGAPPSDNKLYGKVERVARGGMTSSGHYDSLSLMFRNAKRTHWRPDSSGIDLGFRCAKDAEQK